MVVVARAILDFCYYAQLHVHSSESLDALEGSLAAFHANKDILEELKIREHFNIPKLHQLSHYVQSIRLFGAADGFDSELPAPQAALFGANKGLRDLVSMLWESGLRDPTSHHSINRSPP